MSEVKVNKVSPRSGTNVQLGDSGDTITVPTGATLDFPANSIANADLTGNGQITINGQAVALGGSITITTITRPTYNSGQSFTIPPTTNTSITIAGTNFQSVPVVEAINNSTGAITRAVTVSFSSSSSIDAVFNLALGTYFIRIENNDGGAVRSTNADLSVSTSPTWTTNAGSLGTFAAGSTISGLNVVAGSDSNVTIIETTSILTSNSDTPATTMNLTLSGTPSTTATYTISGTAPSPTSDQTYNFTLRATDVEGQTADRSFSITISTGANNSGQFN
tara:strand:+ start:1251 stop:2084 length:834 start_codon:yes stop_codon:yes gene_type:complete